MPQLNGLVIAGNDVRAVEVGCRVAADGDVSVVAGGGAGPVGVWGVPRLDKLACKLARYPESPLTAQIIASLLIEEIRKDLLPLANEAGRSAGRQVVALSRLAAAPVNGRDRPFRLATDQLHMVGAGALGTWFGVGLGLAGVRAQLHVFDGDQVEETNLNRQVLFAGAIGKPKATVLAARLQSLFPTLRTTGYGARIAADTEEIMEGSGVIAACPDSFQVRAFLASHCPAPPADPYQRRYKRRRWILHCLRTRAHQLSVVFDGHSNDWPCRKWRPQPVPGRQSPRL